MRLLGPDAIQTLPHWRSSRVTHLVYRAFVGCNHTHTLAVVNPPDHHRIVRRAAREAVTVRVEVDAEHAIRMTCIGGKMRLGALKREPLMWQRAAPR